MYIKIKQNNIQLDNVFFNKNRLKLLYRRLSISTEFLYHGQVHLCHAFVLRTKVYRYIEATWKKVIPMLRNYNQANHVITLFKYF